MSSVLEVKGEADQLFKDKSYADAIAKYTQAIGLGASDKKVLIALYSNRSSSHHFLNNFDKALADGNKCIELDAQWLVK